MKTTTRRLLASVATLSLALGGALLISSPAAAATFTVTTTADSGPGSLRYAITAANASVGPDTVTFALPGNSTIEVLSELPEITDDLSISGPGSGALTITDNGTVAEGFWSFACSPIGITISGLAIDGFEYSIDVDCVTLSISDVVVSGARGEALYAEHGSAAISNSHFDENNAGGYLQATGTQSITVTDSSFSNNDFGGALIATAVGATATLSGLSASGNRNGIGLELDAAGGSSIVAGAITATGNSDYGLSAVIDDSTVSLSGSAIDNNDLGNIAIVADNSSEVRLAGVTANGSSFGEGGAIGLTDSSLAISDSEFSANAGHNNHTGGGLSVVAESSTASITATTLVDNHADYVGGGLLVDAVDSAFTLSGLTVTGNSTDGPGGGIYIAEILGATASVTLADSTVSGNSAEFGGGILTGNISTGSPSGGLLVYSTTIDGNTAADSIGGIGILTLDGNVDPALPSFSLIASTISNNSTDGSAGGLYVNIGVNVSSLMQISNSTISGNSAGIDGGAALFPSGAPSTLRVTNSTISGNTAPSIGGILSDGADLTTELVGSVIANSTNGDLDLGDGTLLASYSLVEDPSAAAATALASGTGNRTGVDPKLGALANNGGTTRTMLPLAGSPLINAGDPASAGAPTTDQRGLARISGPRIDIGSVEVQQVLAATGSSDPAAPLLGGALIAFAGIVLLVVRRRRMA